MILLMNNNTTHQLRINNFSPYIDFNYFRSDYVLRVEGAKASSFSLNYVPSNGAAREVTNGPLVPGPRLGAFGNSTCIAADPRMGTAAEHERAAAEHRLINARIGDTFVDPEGNSWILDWHRWGAQVDYHNIRFVKL